LNVLVIVTLADTTVWIKVAWQEGRDPRKEIQNNQKRSYWASGTIRLI